MDQHTTKETMPPPHDRDPSPIINTTAGNNHHVLPAEHTSQSATTAATTNINVNGSNIHSNRRSDSIDSSTSTTSTSSNAPFKPHTGGNVRWDAINSVSAKDSSIGLTHFRLLRQLGYGDFGSVYLVELKGTRTYYAMKVMDKSSLANWNKLIRAQTEREILGLLDHPFLPTLYSHFETDQFYCLVMEFCSGGNLHSLLQKQPNKRFTEEAARFYASEILLALEYLHMLGIVYRDLKPENVLVRDEGHIMLADFDLSLRCSVSPTLVKSSSINGSGGGSSGGGSAGIGGSIGGLVGGGGINNNSGSSSRGAMLSSDELALQRGCMRAPSFLPRILPTTKKNRKSKSDFGLFVGGSMPELMAEPSNVRSMSFVGTHEYLAPEIILGEGHGSAVDWWTLGIFLYELLHGTTPFKGSGNRATLFNVVGQPLRFPDTPGVSFSARDLIRGLLVKEPHKRIAYRRGATEIKQHPFFEGVNWALVRSAMPPHIPDPVDFSRFASKNQNNNTNTNNNKPVPTHTPAPSATSDDAENTTSQNDSSNTDFEYF